MSGQPSPTVAVVALDAMDAVLTLRLAGEGVLPTLAHLLDTSWSRPVANPKGLLVGSVWPTFWSGSGPAHHGFYCFRQLENGTYDVVRRTPGETTIPPVWVVASDAGRRCAVIDAPMLVLAPDLTGIQTVEWGAHDRIVPFSASPASLGESILAEFGPHPVPRCDAFTTAGDLAGLRRALLAGVETKGRIAERHLGEGSWDLFIVGHSEAHCAGHQFWSVHDAAHERHDTAVRAELGDPLVDVYRALDAALGRLLGTLGDDGIVFVVLSHGMGAHYDGDHLLSEILTRLDDALMPRPRAVRLRESGLRYLGRRRRAKTRSTALDGSRRLYRAPNNELHGAIRINLVGREPRGRVQPGPELDHLVDELRRELLALTDPDSGRPIVRDVWRTSEIHAGPALDALPDLLVDWIRTEPIVAAASPTIGTVRPTYEGGRTGDHRPTGLLIARGPGIGPTRDTSAVRSMDLAPTVAAILGLELPDAEGRPIAELVDLQR